MTRHRVVVFVVGFATGAAVAMAALFVMLAFAAVASAAPQGGPGKDCNPRLMLACKPPAPPLCSDPKCK